MRPSLLLCLAVVFFGPFSSLRADIFRWDNGELIPGTEGITPGPGVNLERRELAFAALQEMELQGADFDFANLADANLSVSNLRNAYLYSATLTNANLRETNLTNAYLQSATLTNANLSGAVVKGAGFQSTTSRGFTPEQLYSTRSYQEQDLRGIVLRNNNLSDWNFAGQDLTSAIFAGCYRAGCMGSDLASADLSGANLTNAEVSFSQLANANLSEAVLTGARFNEVTSRGFTKEQLYSTASYQSRNLSGIQLGGNDLGGWDFQGQDLTMARLNSSTLTSADLSGANLSNANLGGSMLTNANLSGALVPGVNFAGATTNGFIREQLYSTASYQLRHLEGIRLEGNDLSGWDFQGQSLVNARLGSSTLTGANLSLADLTNADLSSATVTNTDFRGAAMTGARLEYSTFRGFTKEQLYSSASFLAKNLEGIMLGRNDLSGWDFRGQNLTNGGFYAATLVRTKLSGADTRGAQDLDLTLAFTDNTIQPDGTIAGLELVADDRLVVRNYHGNPNQGLGAIPIRALDEMTVASGGALQFRFEADPWDSLISFEPGIPVQLGGTLELGFADDVDVAAQVGRTIQVFDWTGVEPNGAFGVSSLYEWDTSELYSTGEVTLTSVPEPGSILLAVCGAAVLLLCARRRGG